MKFFFSVAELVYNMYILHYIAFPEGENQICTFHIRTQYLYLQAQFLHLSAWDKNAVVTNVWRIS